MIVCFAQGAVKAIVAMNDAVGLRFMHHEDVAVGMWMSGLNIRHIRQGDEHAPRVAYIGDSSPEELKVLHMGSQYVKSEAAVEPESCPVMI